MKKIIPSLILLVIFALKLNSQNVQLNLKFNKKIGGASKDKESKTIKDDVKSAEKDSVDDFLDLRSYEKDSQGLSGVYFCKSTIYYDEINPVKKFLLQYDEKKCTVKLCSRSLDNAEFFSGWGESNGNIIKKYQNTCSAIGSLMLPTGYGNNRRYKYVNDSSSDRASFNNLELYTYEPGIIVLMKHRYEVNDFYDPKNKEELAIDKDGVILYKKEQATKALSLTNVQVHEFCKDRAMRFYKQRNKEEILANKVPQKFQSTKSSIPTKAELNELAARYLKENAGTYGNTTLLFSYPITDWQNQYALINNTFNTLTWRSINVIIAIKSPDGNCYSLQVRVAQNNLFTTGSFNENFKNQPFYVEYSWGYKVVDCAGIEKIK